MHDRPATSGAIARMERGLNETRQSCIPPIKREALSVNEFCASHGICRASFYNLLKAGVGPRLMKVGRRTLISVNAAREWRERLERIASVASGEA